MAMPSSNDQRAKQTDRLATALLMAAGQSACDAGVRAQCIGATKFVSVRDFQHVRCGRLGVLRFFDERCHVFRASINSFAERHEVHRTSFSLLACRA